LLRGFIFLPCQVFCPDSYSEKIIQHKLLTIFDAPEKSGAKGAMEKHVLGLELPTDPRWVKIAEKEIREILIDHAYCEQKAASSCISLIVSYPQHRQLVETLTPIVAEEWSHFQRVLEELKKRGWGLGAPRQDEYVRGLHASVKKGGSPNRRLVEQLLVNALIEARSCERFRLLSKEIQDEGLRAFYHELMVAEASHYKTFLQLAKQFEDPDYVMNRWYEFLEMEGKLVATLAVRGDRMH
jgi:tRNA-(ms[2]io[6]A)-hydroxylase